MSNIKCPICGSLPGVPHDASRHGESSAPAQGALLAAATRLNDATTGYAKTLLAFLAAKRSLESAIANERQASARLTAAQQELQERILEEPIRNEAKVKA